MAATLALTLTLAGTAGCERGQPTPSTAPDAAADPAQPKDRSVAVVSDGTLDPDPDQLAAGVPYLRFGIEVGESPARGPADAPVTIVMFSDFECHYCEEAFHTVEELEQEYAGKIRLVYKALPLALHQHALEAALVGHSAQAAGKFWEYQDLIFSGGGIDPATIQRYAREVGLDLDQVASELESLEHAPAVRRDLRVAKRLKLHSTPVFFINGRMLPGARPKHIFRHMIDQELSLAERLADDGIASAELYDYATQWGYTALVYEDEAASLDEDKVYPVPIGDSPVRGPADAPITIIAFSDFQCPFCARGHVTMEELRARYGDQIRFVFKHFPLPGHPMAALASRASFAAAKVGKFWEFHDAIFEFGGRFRPEDLSDVATKLGIPRASLETAMTTEQYDPRIEADLRLGGSLMVDGTPAYFINGRPIIGAHPLMDFRMLITEELERVEQAREQGIAPADIYAHLTGTKE
ncbi:DsbA family protein [Enhygromyxa salina]|uniref:Disulfide bond formation protein D n=1 Tax=Enhygromyxa salina TaxID=215803 RepID=A0A2S9YND8_9BACT|nr:thioredoxin domain-containing protein [Enhygromyxa salina]PRQ06601.1 Disulfide bond formation protein D precursor [Enhygromyxa salina]